MKTYQELLQDVLDNGVEKQDRTGVGTLSVFGRMIRFDLSKGFPAVTTKRLFFRGVVEELLWFLRGQTDSKILEDKGINIWKGNTTREFLDQKGLTDYPEGEAGPIY
ncbi:MAG: thymidylate synthase, partial [Bacteroidota bacterium]